VTQTARPTGTTLNNWTLNGAGTAHQCLNDESDSTRISDISTADAYGTLGTLSDPGLNTGHVIRIRGQSAPGTGSATASLYQGNPGGAGTLIATTPALSELETPTEDSYTLSGAEADAITDYATLYWRVQRGTGTFVGDILEYRFDVPDGGGGGGAGTGSQMIVVGL